MIYVRKQIKYLFIIFTFVVLVLSTNPAWAKRTIYGKVTSSNGKPIAGATVKAYDSDVNKDDFMGSAKTDGNGNYKIHYRGGAWDGKKTSHHTQWRPDIYIVVVAPDHKRFKSKKRNNHKLKNDLRINARLKYRGGARTAQNERLRQEKERSEQKRVQMHADMLASKNEQSGGVDLQITSVVHPGPNPHLVNNPDVPIPNDLSAQTELISSGPNTGTRVLERSIYAKATVTNMGSEDAILPSGFKYLGGGSFAPYRQDNTSSAGEQLIGGGSKVIGLYLKQPSPRAPRLAGGSTYRYQLIVDPSNNLSERNEGNNSWVKLLNNPYTSNEYSMADLVIERIYFTNNKSYRGTIDMHVVIKNQGARRTILSAPLSSGGDILWRSNNPLSSHANDNTINHRNYSYHIFLEPGRSWDSVRHRVNWYRDISSGANYFHEISSGCYTFTVQLNPNRTIPESNTTNNTASINYAANGSVCPEIKKAIQGPMRQRKLPIRQAPIYRNK